MALLIPKGGNFNDVPNVNPQVSAGIYNLQIVKTEIKPQKVKQGETTPRGNNLVVESKILDEGPFKDRKMTQYISVDSEVQIKRQFLSAGVAIRPDGGVDTDDLKDKIFRAEVRPRIYNDPATGAQKETSDIAQVLIPGDPHFDATTPGITQGGATIAPPAG